MKKREWLMSLAECVVLGLVLFFSAVSVLLVTHDMEHLEMFADKMFWILGIYLAAAVLMKVVSELKIIQRISFLFSGAAIVYWVTLFLLPLEVLGVYLDSYLRKILTVNALVLIFLMIGNFVRLKYIAKELNHGKWKKGFRLIEDIECRLENEDEFMRWIEQYCAKNALDLKVLRYGIPAEIQMDGMTYRVQMTEYASIASGVIPAVEFVQIQR